MCIVYQKVIYLNVLYAVNAIAGAFIFFVTKSRIESPLELKRSKVHLRTFPEFEQKEINNPKSKTSYINLDKLWEKECDERRKNLYNMSKNLFWKWKKTCIKHNIHFNWDMEKWSIWKDIMNKDILREEQKDKNDYTIFKDKNYNFIEFNHFIIGKRSSFKLFCENMLKKWDIFYMNSLKDWDEHKKKIIKVDEKKKNNKKKIKTLKIRKK
ncbi:Plasmodium exported protein, unknown function [Plasmodium relictum]|uniref:Plasmodium RESA N-terminal domain-containing protein n=1 Tax=Plasmodium relictum TaxID=85471 RepID=A0A1J1GJZ1_PLARL|nr:Plasmodium exported protein, unknown function [Plasmodium relictum]CRG84293.1 Plasmodium exported protein, unknown function [Plasmodium relictum]